MNTQMHPSRALLSAAVLVAMVVLWAAFAPQPFGGQTSYVMVAGASMEPALHQGDLVLVRPAQVYHVGDIATYQHPLAGPIIHRIVARQGEHFLLQGDNNDWRDSYSPSAPEMVGRAWLTLRGGADLLDHLRTPGGLALLSLSFGLMLLATVQVGGKATDTQAMHPRRLLRRRKAERSEAFEGALLAVAAVALGSTLLLILAFSRPTMQSLPEDIAYEHHGTFAYHAGAPASVYAGGALQTGDPVYDEFVPQFQVSFSYALVTAEPAQLAGTYRLTMELSEPNGWRRNIVLLPETPFTGSSFTAAGTVDVSLIRRMVELLESTTRIERPSYAVEIVPEVELSGELGGQAFSDRFAPRLTFVLEPLQLYMRQADPLAADVDPLHPSVGGFVPRLVPAPATLPLLGLTPTVTALRWIGAIGLLLSLAGLGLLVAPMVRAYQEGGLSRSLAKHGALLVSVDQPPKTAKVKPIEVASLDDLVKLAEKDARMILHAKAGRHHDFYVQDGETTYHFGTEADVQEGAEPA